MSTSTAITISRTISDAKTGTYVEVLTAAEYEDTTGEVAPARYIVTAHGDGHLTTDDAVGALRYAAKCADLRDTTLPEALHDLRRTHEDALGRLADAADEGDRAYWTNKVEKAGDACDQVEHIIHALDAFHRGCVADADAIERQQRVGAVIDASA